MSNESSSNIITDTCDDCGTKAPGVVHHQTGTQVMFICKNCDGKMFERHARRDIDTWLAGGDFGG